MGLLRFARKEKAPSPSSRKPNSSTANFISSSAFQAIIQDTGATGSLLDDILKELHPTNEGIERCVAVG
ncbi:hypothetical protein BX666DRAFT_1921351 [Dichotomocladium elegans]|nr:hypothetical protein BX666DRAFT_1921351 [Dichotomocladium elegans]